MNRAGAQMMDPEEERRRKTRLFWAGVYGLPLVSFACAPLGLAVVRYLFWQVEGSMASIFWIMGALLFVSPSLASIGIGLLIGGFVVRSGRLKAAGVSALLAAAGFLTGYYVFEHPKN